MQLRCFWIYRRCAPEPGLFNPLPFTTSNHYLFIYCTYSHPTCITLFYPSIAKNYYLHYSIFTCVGNLQNNYMGLQHTYPEISYLSRIHIDTAALFLDIPSLRSGPGAFNPLPSLPLYLLPPHLHITYITLFHLSIDNNHY